MSIIPDPQNILPDDNPLSDTRNPTGTAPMACCVQLRCKTMYYRPDEREGKVHESDTSVHWCMQTQNPIGPDNAEVKPSACQPGRGCFCR